MADYPRFEYSMMEVERAGKALAGDLIWADETADKIREVFRIANNYRDSHAYPMARLRHELRGEIRKNGLKRGITVARLKRMPSIRRKLRAISTNLNQIQDLAGCRAIVEDIQSVNALVKALKDNSNHKLHREDAYTVNPKPDGYRSHHLVFKFRGNGDDNVYNNRRVEIQVRTQLQHSWATAVEAVGLFRHEDLKAGHGNSDWLKLFRLMSAEFAADEDCAPNGDDRKARATEITALAKQLKAVKILEDLRQAVRITDDYYFDPLSKPQYFLIRYDRTNSLVSVSPQFAPIDAVKSYDTAEGNEVSGSQNSFVLVEVDEIESLKLAYPNYFGDVQRFKEKLQLITEGSASEFSLSPQPTAPPKPRTKPDLSWLRSYKRWR